MRRICNYRSERHSDRSAGAHGKTAPNRGGSYREPGIRDARGWLLVLRTFADREIVRDPDIVDPRRGGQGESRRVQLRSLGDKRQFAAGPGPRHIQVIVADGQESVRGDHRARPLGVGVSAQRVHRRQQQANKVRLQAL